MYKDIKFKTVTVSILGANGEIHEYHTNNEYKKTTKEDVINIFNLEPLYYASVLEDNLTNPKSFNTYNWNAPFTLCGVASEDIYEGVAIVNIHLGGDARGNYSEPYICEEPEAIFLQTAFLYVELTNGKTYTFDCDNSEAYFDFNTFDPYYINFEENVTMEQLKELEESNN